MVTKSQGIKFLVASVGLNLGVGATLGILAVPSIKKWYKKLKKPSWTPPNAVFGPIWSILYTSMGVASWMVFKQGGFSAQKRPLGLYALHLAVNFAWQPLFFQAKRLDVAMVDISALLVMTAATAKAFHKVAPKAGALMLPELAWVAYAAALNAALLKLNPAAHTLDDGAVDEVDGMDIAEAKADGITGSAAETAETAADVAAEGADAAAETAADAAAEGAEAAEEAVEPVAAAATAE
eukprot:jgi/Ulvmu1/775/UM010_0149.1